LAPLKSTSPRAMLARPKTTGCVPDPRSRRSASPEIFAIEVCTCSSGVVVMCKSSFRLLSGELGLASCGKLSQKGEPLSTTRPEIWLRWHVQSIVHLASINNRKLADTHLFTHTHSPVIMAPSRPAQSWLISLFAIFTILATHVRALHFYIENRQPKCFFEELPKDTLVVGR